MDHSILAEIVLVVFAGSLSRVNSNLTQDETRQRSRDICVERYQISIDLAQAPVIDETTYPVCTSIVFDSSVRQTWIDYLGQAVEAVIVNGDEVPVDFDGARIAISGLVCGATNVVTIRSRSEFSRTGQGMHRFVDPVDDAVYLYTHSEPADSRRIFPNFEQPDMKANFEFCVRALKEWQVWSNQPLDPDWDGSLPDGHCWQENREATAGTGEGARPRDEQSPCPTDLQVCRFKPTPKLSTYLIEVSAGPYHVVESEWVSADRSLTIPLRWGCRQSLSQYLDADDLFRVTGQCLTWFDENFGYPYPWGKYDQIFVPEYNIGAMENPGCVTFTENMLFVEEPSRAQLTARANVIAHEMTHMWFGDLVTPTWWDELWLKEAFAEYMGTFVAAEATEYTEAWVTFAVARKAWAYAQDETAATHPIQAQVDDLATARQNFDGITYAKGAAVLKQLVAYVGIDHFLAGARDYFQRHAFSSTTLPDFISCLEKASGEDLDDWVRSWLQTSGPDRLRVTVDDAGDRGVRLFVRQQSVDVITGKPVGRPHRLGVGLFRADPTTGRLECDRQLDLVLRRDQAHRQIEAQDFEYVVDLDGPRPDLIMMNRGDHSYAICEIDPQSIQVALQSVAELADPLDRATVWSQLISAVDDARLDAQGFVAAVANQLHNEGSSAILQAVLTSARSAITNCVAPELRGKVISNYLTKMIALLEATPAATDMQRLLVRHLAGFAPKDVEVEGVAYLDWLQGLVTGDVQIDGVNIDLKLRWAIIESLASAGMVDQAFLDAQIAVDDCALARDLQLGCQVAMPDLDAKRDAFTKVCTPGRYTNKQIDQITTHLIMPGQETWGSAFVDPYFSGLMTWWDEHPMELAERLAKNLYWHRVDLDGDSVDANRVVLRSNQWLDDHREAPSALRRIIHENTHLLVKRLRAQALSRTQASSSHN